MAKQKNVSSTARASALAIVKSLFAGKANKLGFVAENVRRHITTSGRIATKVQNDALTRLFNKMTSDNNAFTGKQLTTLEFITEYVMKRDIQAASELMRDESGRIVIATEAKRHTLWGTLQRRLKVFCYEISDVVIEKNDNFTKGEVQDLLKTAGKYYLSTVQSTARKMPRAVKVVKAVEKPLVAAAAA